MAVAMTTDVNNPSPLVCHPAQHEIATKAATGEAGAKEGHDIMKHLISQKSKTAFA